MVADAAALGHKPDGPEVDRELLARVRAGDDSAFGELFSRHAEAVRRFSFRHVSEPAEADDLTAEAFFRVLQAIRRGSGPTDHVRTYLLTVARRVAMEWSDRRRDVPVEDEELNRRAEPYPDTCGKRAEHNLIARAFSSLPERWRTVLWQVEVEGERPSSVASHFGLSANSMAALARRAREGLRAAYLQAHLAEERSARSCRSVVVKLGTYTAGGVQGGEERRIRKHLQTCSSCSALHAELAEVCSSLRAHAALMAVPVSVAVLGNHLLAQATVVGKGALLAGRVKLALAAASVAAVGVFGVAVGAFTSEAGPGLIRADQGEALTLHTTTTTSSATVGAASADRQDAFTTAAAPQPIEAPVHRSTQLATSVQPKTTTTPLEEVVVPAPATHRLDKIAQPPASTTSPTVTPTGELGVFNTPTETGVVKPGSPTTTTVIIHPTPVPTTRASETCTP